ARGPVRGLGAFGDAQAQEYPGEVAHAGLLKTTAARDLPKSSMFFSSNGKTFFSARRSSASDTPALRVRGSERSPASSGWTSVRRSWKRYTARAVATWTSAGRWLSRFLTAGRVSVSSPTSL